jgi:hypothetical protein
MAILFSTAVAIGLVLGWVQDLMSQPVAQQLLVGRCVLASLSIGFVADLLVARWRLAVPGGRWWNCALGIVTINWLSALGVSAVAAVMLVLPAFDSVRTGVLIASVIVVESVAVCSIASVIRARRLGRRATRVELLRGFANFALLNAVSMAIGVAAGRLYLNVFYPGVG